MNKPKILLDIKGLIMHSFFRCADNDSTLFDSNNKKIARAHAAFETFLNSYLLPILEDSAPKDVIAAWDNGSIRRRNLFNGYKKRRSEKEKDPVVEAQLGLLYKYTKDFLAGLGAVQVSVPKTEADDVIAYLAGYAKPCCVVHTVDYDLIQLASPTCVVLVKQEPMDEMPVTASGNTPAYSVPASLVPLHKSIVGDSSDEYPGVKGLGHRAWLDMVDSFGLDGMEELATMARTRDYDDLESAVAGTGDKYLTAILNQKYQWILMYELASLHPEWCEGAYERQLIKPQWFKRIPNRERVESVLSKTFCEDLLEKIEPYLPVTILVTADNVDEVVYGGTFTDDLNASIVALDYETYDINNYGNFKQVADRYVDVLSQRLTGASFTFGPNLNKTIYVCVNHKDTNNCQKEVIKDLLSAIKTPVVQNASFEYTVTVSEFGKEFADSVLRSPIDTAILSSYVDENSPAGLKDNSKQWLRYIQITYDEVVGDKQGMHEVSGPEVLQYGADDAICTAHLWSLWDYILELEKTREFCYANEFKTSSIMTDSFIKGCKIHLGRLEKLAQKDQKALDTLWPELKQILTDHCQDHNAEAAAAYLADTRNFLITSMKEAGKSETEIQDAITAMSTRLWEATVYSPYKEIVIPYEFKPTLTQLNAVLEKLGLPKDGQNSDKYFLQSLAIKRVSDWVFTINELAKPNGEAVGISSFVTSDPLITEEILKFAGLLAEAAHQLKNREGEEYSRLANYVVALFPEKNKVEVSGDQLNLDSPKQMAELLYCKLALPIRHRSKVQPGSTRDSLGFAGGPATNDKAIEIALAEDCQEEGNWKRRVLECIREIKSIQTKFKFYYSPYPLWIRPDTGRIHAGIKNCGTVTRRPAGTSPNLLQVKKGPIRSLYLPMEDDHVLVAPDFSGQELRILGSESHDPALLDAYMGESRKDIHSLTASAILPNICRHKAPALFKEIVYAANKTAQSYEQFNRWYAGEEGEEKQKLAEWVRNKRAKACIAEDSQVLTNRGLVPIQDVQRTDMVWDGFEFVFHDGVICKGARDIMEYDGLSATTDHEVYLDDGLKIQIGKLPSKQTRPRLAVGEVGGAAVKFNTNTNSTSVLEEWDSENQSKMLILQEREDVICGQCNKRENQGMQLRTKKVYGQKDASIKREIHCNKPAGYPQELEIFQELRGQGDSELVQFQGGFHNLGIKQPSSPVIQRSTNKQDRQRRALSAWESKACFTIGESRQQEIHCSCQIQRYACGTSPSMAPTQNRLPKFLSISKNRSEASKNGENCRRDSRPQTQSKRKKVYDILNTGPLHRFTVSGKIVSNCNFLRNYGGGASTLSTNILVPKDEAQQFLDNMDALYIGITPFQELQAKLGREKGYVKTAYGNRRHMTDDILSRDDGLRMRMERQAGNAVIQGCAADILKVVMADCEDSGLLSSTGSYILAPVYDELVCSVPKKHVVPFCQALQKIMDLTPPGHLIPMVSEFAIGFDWFNMIEIKGDTSEERINEALKEAKDKYRQFDIELGGLEWGGV